MSGPRKRTVITQAGRALLAGKRAWRTWRKENPNAPTPDLRQLPLTGRDLSSLDLTAVDLRGADLSQSNLRRTRLEGANLDGCRARFTRFSEARFADATLRKADLRASSLRRADLRRADFTKAVMRFTSMAGANVDEAIFAEAEVYGVGAWALRGEPSNQRGLIIREREGEVATTVDDLETAQYLFLLRENRKIADVINTASHRTILLLGRFTGPNAHVLQGLRDHLLERNFVPVVFDFAQPIGRDLTETITGLAHMACFVIADLTGARSVPQELSHIVPFLPSVPVIPLLAKGQPLYSMFEHFRRYPWVYEPVEYDDLEHLLQIAEKQIISVGFHAAMRARGVSGARLPRPAPRSRRR
ncbi:MAG: pentapeptide repeat-containing protein [Pseudomonadota bacterium]